ncbi:hypothetical protein [Methylobacterium brachythecii]|uniref:Uncharacterized protein n=1 Tax=Methylobacterium brachythecii TaxID=1176177 RepID=A0A7W6AKI1_9HYPH|nr:hypothetical protein [Methylobacterium brachythecii]MBB3904166.1 hypothetical protein [Methylobacterium brachythecii]GLS45172.1 hypothetical protein GCM10007884_31610 [Methylobacterium brachythecii]
MTRFLAALALACACSPAVAEGASEPITGGDIYSLLGWFGIAGLVLGAVAVVLLIAFAAIGGFNDWSR